MFEFLKSEKFSVLASFILGLGLMAVLKPACRGTECKILKAPPLEEITHSTYQAGSKCYKFKHEIIDCPKDGVIEPFQRQL